MTCSFIDPSFVGPIQNPNRRSRAFAAEVNSSVGQTRRGFGEFPPGRVRQLFLVLGGARFINGGVRRPLCSLRLGGAVETGTAAVLRAATTISEEIRFMRTLIGQFPSTIGFVWHRAISVKCPD
jgi:hypothetical protein